MELSSINNSYAMQGGFQQAKAKNSETSVRSVAVEASNMESVKAKLDEKKERVQEMTGADAKGKDINKDQESLSEMLRRVKDKLGHTGMQIQLEVDKETSDVLVLVKDPVTDELIRKIPPDELLKPAEVARSMEKALNESGGEIDFKY